MKTIFRLFVVLALILIIPSLCTFSQVSINSDGTSADASAMLDVKSTNKGLLPSRVELTAINSAAPVTNPAIGLLVYNTANAGTPPNDVMNGYYFWNGTRWIPVSPAQGANLGDMLYWNGIQWVGVSAGSNGQVLTLNNGLPTWGEIQILIISTVAVTDITQTTAISGGNVIIDGGSPVTACGVCWSTTSNPTTADSKTTDGSGTGNFVSNLTELSVNTLYYIRAYATNSVGTSYGNQVSFTTLPPLATISTTTVTNITRTTAISGGNITSDGGTTVTARGVCWSTSASPTIADSHTTDGSGTGVFVSNLTGLLASTHYYVRAYATNSGGTAYGNEESLTSSHTGPYSIGESFEG
jgi:hypothetical protein